MRSPRAYANPRLSPDGDRLLVQAGDLWFQDLSRPTFTRLTPRDAVINAFPMWMPDGRRVIYRSPNGLRIQDADGSGAAQTIAQTADTDYPGGLTPDGESLVFMRSTQQTSFDIEILSLRNPTQRRPLLNSAAYESGARLSPDGRWLVYVSNESGQNDVYLRPFPALDRRWTISTQGGTQPVWNPNGREIFYRSGDKMMSVEVTTSSDIKLSTSAKAVRAALCVWRGHHDPQLRRDARRPAFHHGQGGGRRRTPQRRLQLVYGTEPPRAAKVGAAFRRPCYRPVKVACPLKTDSIAAAAHRSPSAPAETPIAPMT